MHELMYGGWPKDNQDPLMQLQIKLNGNLKINRTLKERT